jgi:hypothetical protein
MNNLIIPKDKSIDLRALSTIGPFKDLILKAISEAIDSDYLIITPEQAIFMNDWEDISYRSNQEGAQRSYFQCIFGNYMIKIKP